MAVYYLDTVDRFRTNTREEAKSLIEEAERTSMYDVKDSRITYKEVKPTKDKDGYDYYIVTLKKFFTDEKEPDRHIKPTYEVDDIYRED